MYQYTHVNPVPPITYWWIWMPLQEVKISIGTQTRSGSTIINTPRHAKIDAQQLFYFVILPVGGTLIDLVVSMKAGLELCTDAYGILISDKCEESKSALPRTTREPFARRWARLVASNHICYCFAEKWSWKKNKWELSVMAWMNELVWKIRVRTSTWHHEVHIIILFFVVKAASEEHNVIRVLCGNLDFCLPARVLGVQNKHLGYDSDGK